MNVNTIFKRFTGAAKILMMSLLGCLLFTGCKPATIAIVAPHPSAIRFSEDKARLALGVIDVRSLDAKTVTSGALTSTLSLDNHPFEPIAFLKSHLRSELQARGFDVDLQPQAELRLKVSQFSLHTQRSGQFAPFVIWAALKGELESSRSSYPITVLVIKDYYPKMTYGELSQPLYSDALNLMVKETANKILRHSLGSKLSDERIETLGRELTQTTTDVEPRQLYPLIFSNNPKAGATLVEYTQSRDRQTKLTALYGLGVVQARDFLPTLSALYFDSHDSTERAIIFKSILDLGSHQANIWVKREMEKMDGSSKQDPSGLLRKTFLLYQ